MTPLRKYFPSEMKIAYKMRGYCNFPLLLFKYANLNTNSEQDNDRYEYFHRKERDRL